MKFRVMSLVAAAVLAAAVGGCTEPISSTQDPYVEYPQVHVTSYWMKTWTRVQPPIVQRVGNGQVEVDVPIRNLTDEDLSVDYQYTFTSKGASIEGPSSWHNLVIPRKGIGHIQFSSLTTVPPSPQGDFDLTIRYRK